MPLAEVAGPRPKTGMSLWGRLSLPHQPLSTRAFAERCPVGIPFERCSRLAAPRKSGKDSPASSFFQKRLFFAPKPTLHYQEMVRLDRNFVHFDPLHGPQLRSTFPGPPRALRKRYSRKIEKRETGMTPRCASLGASRTRVFEILMGPMQNRFISGPRGCPQVYVAGGYVRYRGAPSGRPGAPLGGSEHDLVSYRCLPALPGAFGGG